MVTPETNERYDVVVVGGGAAGLAAALLLGRSRRSVLVVDAGEPRNALADGVHGFLTREGMSPAALLAVGQAEVRCYGGEILDGRAVSASRGQDGFTVVLDDGKVVAGRRLLLTTGLVDELPDVPGVRERWGRDVLHCPYCHGWEVRDGALGVLASGPRSVHQALLFGQWTSDLTLFLHTTPDPTPEEAEQLAARGVVVVGGRVASLEVSDDRLVGVRMVSGEVVPRQAVVVAPRFTTRAELFASLGLQPVEHPMGVGTQLATDPNGLTDVPGVWAAGNVADLMAQVVGAAAAGTRAAGAINADLIAEEVQHAVATYRSSGAV